MAEKFQRITERKNTRSAKWDLTEKLFQGKNVLPMWVADMDFESPDAVQEAIFNRAKHNIYGYSITDDNLNEAVIKWLEKRHNWSIDPSWIIYSPGVVASLYMIVQALTDVNDKVLIQTPVYPPFYSAVEGHGRTIVKNSLNLVNGKYEIDYIDFEEKIKDESVTMFILCSPHNPTGRVWSVDELTKMAQLCKKYNVIIVSDEIHADLVYKGYKHTPIASIQEVLQENIITCMAPSKTFNLAGLQASYIVAPNKGWRAKIDKQFKSQGIMGLNTFGIVALEAAYLHGEEWLETLLDVVEENRNYVITKLHETKRIDVIQSEGTYLLWLDCRKLDLDDKQLKDFFQKQAKVGLNDGATFGEEGKGFMRLNIACPKAIVEEGVNRIINALNNL